MTNQVEEKKWILYRHTSDFNLITRVAMELKTHSKTLISMKDREELLQRLSDMNFYTPRNPKKPLDAINHRINTLEFFMFGYKAKVNKEKRFLFSPLGNLFIKHVDNRDNIRKIFLTMLWALPFPHTYGGTDSSFTIYPFRLIFKLLSDKRLNYKLYAIEYAWLVAFVKKINSESYDNLVKEILEIRKLNDAEIEKMFKSRRHVLVNSIYEWDYYYKKLFEDIGLFTIEPGHTIFKMAQGNSSTTRNVTRNAVKISSKISSYVNKLLDEYPFDQIPPALNDPERLKKDVIKEIHSFYPAILLEEIGETSSEVERKLLELPKMIERYSNNNLGKEAYLFEDALVDGFNMFYNVEAEKIGGSGNTDIECLYSIDKSKDMKFAVDAKSTKNKLTSINSGRLTTHREKVGGQYTIVVTSRYVPAVKQDIQKAPIVILLASTLSEFLYNHINSSKRKIDFSEIHEIIMQNLGQDISDKVSDLTIKLFSIDESQNKEET